MNAVVGIQARFQFILFVAGDATNSAQALANLRSMCQERAPGQHHIEIVDVFNEPARALAEGVFMTPTLIRLAPTPVRRVLGSLGDTQKVLHALGLEAVAA